MKTIEISLPDELAQKAAQAGLLSAAAMEALLRGAIEKRQVDELFVNMDKLERLAPALSEEEIDVEIAAARAERARRR